MKRFGMLALTLLLISCGDDSTEPDAELDGTWQFTYSSISGSLIGLTVSCTVTPVTFTITQSGNTFTGTQVGTSQLTCSAGALGTLQQPLTSYAIDNGQLSGSSVTFRFRNSAGAGLEGQNSETLSGTSMSGTTQLTVTVGTTPVTLTGQFTAQRS